jgi:REP element-mobilizing transposase RayT
MVLRLELFIRPCHVPHLNVKFLDWLRNESIDCFFNCSWSRRPSWWYRVCNRIFTIWIHWHTHWAEATVILDASSSPCQRTVVLQSLCVRLRSWQCPIPISIFQLRSRLCLALYRNSNRVQTTRQMPYLKPHSQQTWLVGSHLETVWNVLPNFSDFFSHKHLNSLQPCKLITLANRRFLTIPDTFTWFSSTVLEALWSPSYFVSSVGGVPLEVLRRYIQEQEKPC